VRLGEYELPAERWESISDAAKHLLSRMMRVDPAERITVTSRASGMRCVL
jgi:serine/threonine protein kinase